MSRYYCSIKDENLPFCSLHRLAFDIGVVYNKLSSSVFPELTAKKVIDIQKSIKDGTYTLSPLRLSVFPKIEDLKRPKFNQIIHIKDQLPPLLEEEALRLNLFEEGTPFCVGSGEVALISSSRCR